MIKASSSSFDELAEITLVGDDGTGDDGVVGVDGVGSTFGVVVAVDVEAVVAEEVVAAVIVVEDAEGVVVVVVVVVIAVLAVVADLLLVGSSLPFNLLKTLIRRLMIALLLLLSIFWLSSVDALRQREKAQHSYLRSENVEWYFQTQIDRNKDGVAEFDEFVATLRVIHPDVLLPLQQPGIEHIDSEYEPIREFIKSRDSDSVA